MLKKMRRSVTGWYEGSCMTFSWCHITLHFSLGTLPSSELPSSHPPQMALTCHMHIPQSGSHTSHSAPSGGLPDTSQSEDRKCNVIELPDSFKVGFPIAHLWDVDWHWAVGITEERGHLRATSCTWIVNLEEKISNSVYMSVSFHSQGMSRSAAPCASCISPLAWVIFRREKDNIPLQDRSFMTAADLFGFLDTQPTQ